MELPALQRTCDRGAGHLLPVAPSFFIAHQKVLVVDASQVEVQLSSIQTAGPDQTRMAQRSIGDDNRQLVQPVVHHMVIPHLADWIRPALST